MMPVTNPVVGDVYTIREVVGGHGVDKGRAGILLEEIRNPRSPVFGVEYAFYIERFRPLITQEDDVRLIKSLLISNPVDAGLVPAGVELDA